MDPSREDPSRDEKIIASAPGPDNIGDDENLKVDPIDTARVIDKTAERKLCLKFDVRLMPVLAIMCTHPVQEILRECVASEAPSLTCSCFLDLFNALDKGNIGYAQTAGLSRGTFWPIHLLLWSD
jgi:hypothetical protein